MNRSLKVLLLLFTFLGVGLRVADLHAIVHEISHHVCDHDHEHEDDAPLPCDDSHHHRCTCIQPFLGLPEIPHLSMAPLQITPVAQTAPGIWRMPEDPVYALEIPPIIT